MTQLRIILYFAVNSRATVIKVCFQLAFPLIYLLISLLLDVANDLISNGSSVFVSLKAHLGLLRFTDNTDARLTFLQRHNTRFSNVSTYPYRHTKILGNNLNS